MPIEMFLKLTGIDGESTDAKHKGEIDVLAWSWGLSNETPAGGGGGGGAGRAKIENISINKSVDLASPLLLSFGAQGQRIKEGTLTTRRPGKAGNEFLLLKMTNVVVTSVNVAAVQDQNVPTENVTLGFGKIELTYRSTKPAGGVGTEKTFTWDVAQGKPF
jgi:type VI secretion system secreted protein Hcp